MATGTSDERVARLLSQIDALPRPLFEGSQLLSTTAAYVRGRGRLNRSPHAFHLGALACAMGALLPPTLSLPLFGQEVYGTTYVMLLANSGVAKTSAIRYASKLIEPLDDGARFLSQLPESPKQLIQRFADYPVRFCMEGEFGGQFLKQAANPQTRQSQIASKLLPIWDADPLSWDVATKEAAIAPVTPRLSLCMGATPEHVNQYTDREMWLGGLMGRVLLIRAPHGYDRDVPLGFEDLEAERWVEYARTFLQATALRPWGRCTGFSERALSQLEAWKAKISASVDTQSLFIASSLNRLEMQATRLALALSADPVLGLQIDDTGQDRARVQAACASPRLPYALLFDEATWKVQAAAVHVACALLGLHFDSLTRTIDLLAANDYERIRGQVLMLLEDGPLPLPALLQRIRPRRLKRVIAGALETMTLAGDIRVAGGLYALASWAPPPALPGVAPASSARYVEGE